MLTIPFHLQDAAHQHMLTARALHTAQAQAGQAKFDVLDWSSLIAGARVAAGLDGFDSNKVCCYTTVNVLYAHFWYCSMPRSSQRRSRWTFSGDIEATYNYGLKCGVRCES